jgi:small membrane protein
MKLIQIILLIALIVILISYFRWFRSAALDKILIAIVLLTGMCFVIFPDVTTRIANKLGVGRGADLLFYIAIVAFSYTLLLLYSKTRVLEKQIASLVRKQSLMEAERDIEKQKL